MSSDRRDQFKQPISPEEARARRSELSVSVRKVKREGNLLKRRALRASPALGAPGYGPTDPRSWSAAAPTEGTAYSSHASPSTPALADGTNEMDAASSGNISGSLGLGASDSSSLSQGAGLEYSPLSPTDTTATIDSSVKASIDALATSLLTAPTLEGALAAACGVRRLLASDHPPTELMVSACEGKLVPRLLDLLCNEASSPELQTECAWALTNIASTDQCSVLEECVGAIPALVNMLQSPHPQVHIQVIWCLANVAGDGASARNALLQAGVLRPFLAAIANPTSQDHLRTVAWGLANLCRQPGGVSQVNHLREAIPVLSQLLFALAVPNTEDDEHGHGGGACAGAGDSGLVISHAARSAPPPPAAAVAASPRVLCLDHDAASQALWALSFLAATAPIGTVLVLQSGTLETTVSLAHAAVAAARLGLPPRTTLEQDGMGEEDLDSSHAVARAAAGVGGGGGAHLAWSNVGAELCAGVAEPALKLLSLVAACDDNAASDALLDAGGLSAIRAALDTSATPATRASGGGAATTAEEPRSPLFAHRSLQPSSSSSAHNTSPTNHVETPLSGLLLKSLRQCRLNGALCASNVAAGTLAQRSRLLEDKELVSLLVQRLDPANEPHWSVRLECLYTIANVANRGSHDQVYALLRDHSSVLPQLVACLQAGIGNFSPDVLCIAIDALSRLLATNELASNLFRLPLLLDGAGGIDLLEELQTHQSEEVYSKAAHLIERFFPGGDDDDDDDDDAAADGNTGGGAAFTFGFSENGDGVGGSGGGVGAWSSEDLAELTATLGDLQDSQSNRAVDGKTSSLFCETDEGAELESGWDEPWHLDSNPFSPHDQPIDDDFDGNNAFGDSFSDLLPSHSANSSSSSPPLSSVGAADSSSSTGSSHAFSGSRHGLFNASSSSGGLSRSSHFSSSSRTSDCGGVLQGVASWEDNGIDDGGDDDDSVAVPSSNNGMDENVPPGQNPFAVRVVAPTALGLACAGSGSDSGSGGGGGGIGSAQARGSPPTLMAPAMSFADLPAHRSKPFLDALARCSATTPPPLSQQQQQQQPPWGQHSPSQHHPPTQAWPHGFNGHSGRGGGGLEASGGAASGHHGPVFSAQSGGFALGGAPVYNAPP